MDTIHSLTLGDVLREHRRNYPLKTALVCGVNRFTYLDFDERVNRAVNVLREEGLKSGGKVLWLGQNCHRLVEVMIAAAKCGAVVCPANWRASSEELGFIIRDVNPVVILWQGEPNRETFNEIRQQCDVQARWIQYDGEDVGSYENRIAEASNEDNEVVVDPSSPLLQIYTAAFSGQPNGALLTQLQILFCNLIQAQDVGIDNKYVYLSCGPMFHLNTLQKLFATFQMGGTNVITPDADALTICQVIHRERVNGAMIVEPTISKIVDLNNAGEFDLSSLRTSPARPEWNAMTRPDGVPNQSGGYGQTELGGRLCYPDVGLRGFNGRPHSMSRVRLLDHEGKEVPNGEVGEISVRGPVVMAGYANRDDLNGTRFRNGWYRTNDLGRREEDGSISFVGPMTRMLKSAVENIYPAEVEACIRLHHSVADCALIGVPDSVWGQSAKAIVILKQGEILTADELIDFCREHIASYKKPRFVEFVTSLPKVNGFVDYEQLDIQFGGGGYPGSG